MSVGGHRHRRVVAALAAADPGNADPPTSLEALCHRVPELLAVSGIAVSLWDGARHEGLAWASNQRAGELDKLQVILGEGPAVDSYAGNVPVLVPQLAVEGRWAEFGRAANELGAAAVFGFPLQIGAIRIGVMMLYRSEPGRLSNDEVADALTVSDLVTHLLLAIQSDGGVEVLPVFSELGGDWSVIHQATGMASVQLDTTVASALVRLRAHAYANDETIRETAGRIVDGRLRFNRIGRPGSSTQEGDTS